jgi:hypothetical protein
MAFKPDSPLSAALFDALATILPEPVGMVSGPVKAAKAAASTGKVLKKVGSPLSGKSGKALAGFAHDQGGASIEAISRRAEFWKIGRSGNITPVIQGGEDAAMAAGKDAIVRMTPDGNPVIEGGSLANKKMMDAFNQLPAFGTQKTQFVDDVSKATTHFLEDDSADAADFLKSLGVEVLK